MSRQWLALAVGKLNEPYWRDACAEYAKRLSRYVSLEVREIPDRPDPPGASPAAIEKHLAAEQEAMLKQIRGDDFVVALAVDGKQYTSEGLAAALSGWTQSPGRVVFVIGGSRGLCAEVLKRADARVSLSGMTFPHALARVVLLEQVYRAQKIINGETYHK